MSKPPAPSDIADKFMLRMPEGMRDRLKAAAEENNRSMNAEIVSRLQQSLDGNLSNAQAQSEIEKILERMAANISIKTTSRTLAAVIQSGYSAEELSNKKAIEKLASIIFSPEEGEVHEKDRKFLKDS